MKTTAEWTAEINAARAAITDRVINARFRSWAFRCSDRQVRRHGDVKQPVKP